MDLVERVLHINFQSILSLFVNKDNQLFIHNRLTPMNIYIWIVNTHLFSCLLAVCTIASFTNLEQQTIFTIGAWAFE